VKVRGWLSTSRGLFSRRIVPSDIALIAAADAADELEAFIHEHNALENHDTRYGMGQGTTNELIEKVREWRELK